MKLVVVIIAALAFLVSTTGCMSTPEAGEIGVVRNGGPFDNKNIRGFVDNGSGNTGTGLFSSVHYYPVDTQQRFFKMETCYDGDGAVKCSGSDSEGITVPTADGVDVTIEGIFYLNTVFNNSKDGHEALAAFDTQFATRTFSGSHAYDGPKGWSDFLGAIVEPIVANNLREIIAGVTCADLVSSCALVQNSGSSARVDPTKINAKVNQSKVAAIQEAVQEGLTRDLDETLQRTYFKNIKFNLKRVRLPSRVQDAIDQAQSAFAAVSQAQAKVRSAELEAEANEKRQAGYEKCPTCARIDAIKALPDGVTALGGDFALAVK